MGASANSSRDLSLYDERVAREVKFQSKTEPGLRIASCNLLRYTPLMSVRVVTANINQFITQKGWDAIINNLKPKSDVILLQEAKYALLHKHADDEWGVFHDESTTARAGSGVMWRRELGDRIATGLFELTKPQGFQMETRYIAWVDIEDADGKVTRYGSVHYPPKRYSALWPASHRSIRSWLREARRLKYAFVLGGDYNSDIKTNPVVKAMGLFTRRKHIDGFIVSRRLKASKPEDLGDNRSDHNPVRIVVSRKLTRKKK